MTPRGRAVLSRPWGDERGIALPMALIALVALTSFLMAFTVLSQSEPTIASNQNRAAIARALAESGVERAIWALTNTADPDGLNLPASGVLAGVPYDGSTFFTIGDGGFTLRITGVSNTVARVDSVGWTPTNAPHNAHKRIRADVTRLHLPGRDAPCAVCVRGDLQTRDQPIVDARTDTTCGTKAGALSTGSVALSNEAAFYGLDGNTTPNQGADVLQNQPASVFDTFAFTGAELTLLKEIARKTGTYYRGSVTFDSSHRLPSSGIIFVDTISGNNPTPTSDPTDLGTVNLHADAAPAGGFNGWIIVNGLFNTSGNVGDVKGLFYAEGVLDATGSGGRTLEGIAIARHIHGGTSRLGGNADVRLNCAAANGVGLVPQNWFVAPGTYQEVEGS